MLLYIKLLICYSHLLIVLKFYHLHVPFEEYGRKLSIMFSTVTAKARFPLPELTARVGG